MNAAVKKEGVGPTAGQAVTVSTPEEGIIRGVLARLVEADGPGEYWEVALAGGGTMEWWFPVGDYTNGGNAA